MIGYGKTAAAVLLATALTAACSEPAAPPAAQPQPGVLQLEDYTGTRPESQTAATVHWSVEPGPNTVVPPAVLTVPSEVHAGQPFEAVVRTVGVNGCWRADSQTVTVTGRVVELKPYDRHSGADFCTEALLYLTHTSSITLNEPGEWTVRVTGRRARHGDREWETPVAAETTVTVR